MRTAHLFSGAGGGLLADLILGHTPVYAVDIDNECCEKLQQNAQKWFPGLQVECRDIAQYDASHWAGRVDIISAGIPCPRWSNARRGGGNPVNLWPEILRITEQAGPRFLFIECVENFKREHMQLRKTLETIRYRITEPLIMDASTLGAPHVRKRYWAIAYANNESEPVRRLDAEMAIMSPIDAGVWWETPPCFSGMDDGMADRVYRFKATGNGQVPIQAATAWIILGGDHPSSKECNVVN